MLFTDNIFWIFLDRLIAICIFSITASTPGIGPQKRLVAASKTGCLKSVSIQYLGTDVSKLVSGIAEFLAGLAD